ncbi:Hypothetical protein PBC10988_35080 [Planctomycetales bacterium 10988]|nr:Hypothetical protein PBC10988_35080 [Planctomycetales bacterium 10988]
MSEKLPRSELFEYRCPECGSTKIKYLEYTSFEITTRRHRECLSCKATWCPVISPSLLLASGIAILVVGLWLSSELLFLFSQEEETAVSNASVFGILSLACGGWMVWLGRGYWFEKVRRPTCIRRGKLAENGDGDHQFFSIVRKPVESTSWSENPWLAAGGYLLLLLAFYIGRSHDGQARPYKFYPARVGRYRLMIPKFEKPSYPSPFEPSKLPNVLPPQTIQPAPLPENQLRHHLDRGGAYMDQQQWALAIEELSKALQHAPDEPDILLTRGYAYYQLEEYEQSLQDMHQSIRLNPAEPLPLYTCAEIAILQGQYRTALAYANRILRLEPEKAEGYFLRGIAYQEQQAFVEAKCDFSLGLQLDEKNIKLLTMRAFLLATCLDEDIRDGQQAVIDAHLACTLTGWSQSFQLRALAAAYAEQGDFPHAQQVAQLAIQHAGPEKSFVTHFLAPTFKNQPIRMNYGE